ncbi:TlyA family RNA methyltransferase [Allobranchiibius sp. GilTou73]|uniref:TlyA family RNA methyltransferase n=1 Tax=Allobranchiibius sp. GilTou73 TaxID=2904523 RepID=UPI001F30B96A|nr:TlyA family RNA methyltransferase [Allobranchiibius sp. GilTou73]UIJ34181.1 TlyA family RNA methyltransferase [Allobranchiibius sp. GilTou73]
MTCPADGGTTTRLDQALVARGLARSRAVAADLVQDGRVRVDGTVAQKASMRVCEDTAVAVEGEPERWVGRAAYKLVAALQAFPVDPSEARCIDVGASTGGFTQVLLEAGARQVVALDVGHDQLAAVVADDLRVIEMSGVNVRDLDRERVGGPADVVVADLSFISLRLVLGTLARFTAPTGDLVTLVKPQFEVGRERLGRTGVVISAQQHAEVLRKVVGHAQAAALHVHGLLRSPVVGGSGNTEYLMWARPVSEGKMTDVAIEEFVSGVAGKQR